jgi:hypothetical protein
MRSHNDSIKTTHTPPPLSFYNTFKTLKTNSQETAQNFEKVVLQKFLRITFYNYIPVNPHHFLKNIIITVPLSPVMANEREVLFSNQYIVASSHLWCVTQRKMRLH